MKYILLCIAFLLPAQLWAQDLDAGFVQGLWYSSEEILEGVPVRIYAAFRNNTEHDLVGNVRFMDNGTLIGSAPVSALSGRLVETWIDWTPTQGEHALSVTLQNVELHVIGGEVINAEVDNIVVEDTRFADIDSDGDGVGNMRDMDDDDDGVSDEDEISRGTNPLVANPEPVPEEDIEEETSTTTEAGLERYLDAGVSDTLLNNVTEKVQRAKKSLDEYRERRNERLSAENAIPAGEATSTEEENATITRESIEGTHSTLNGFVGGVAALLQNMYTLLLWILSLALSYPSLIQLLLLLSILYIVYRIGSRLARRQL